MAYTVFFVSEVVTEGDIKNVQKAKLKGVIEQLEQTPEVGKPLTDDLVGWRSTRIGGSDGRVVYRIVEETKRVEVVAMGRRRASEVYNLASSRVSET